MDILSNINNIDTIITQNHSEIILFNPYRHKGKLRLKGSMHNHTDNSISTDGYGSGDPAATAIKFRDFGGFDFYTFTDHNHITGDPLVTGIIWMGNSVEDTQNSQHICAYNLPAGYQYTNKGDDINTLIEYYHSMGAIVGYAHPDWVAQIHTNSNDKILSINNLDFVEIINGDTSIRAYNLLLTKGIIFGIGVDDYHYNSAWEYPDQYFNKGYIVAFAGQKEKKSIWQALLSGCFYSSSGAKMDISCENGLIAVSSDKSSLIEIIGKNEQNLAAGKILKSVDEAIYTSYLITGDESYVWIRLTNNDGSAYSQAFIIL
jgi:hypothetical protein